MKRLCPESGKATGRLEPSTRRAKCALCGRPVHQVALGEHIVVARHYWDVYSSTPSSLRPSRSSPRKRRAR